MPYSPGHLTTQTLELLMDEMLSSAERNEAEAHLEGCELCAAELEGCRALSVALAGLPRFAPSVTFAESVMARVTIAPQGSLARMRRWLPVTRRGWMMLAAALLAPLAPLVAALGWLLSQPLVTVGGVWSMGERWTVRALWSFAASAFEATSRSGAWSLGRDLLDRGAALATNEIFLVAILLVLSTPLAAWSLARLLRTPEGEITHAH